jgi:outer membrane protein OmpA-like peptidoglycan-associated protein
MRTLVALLDAHPAPEAPRVALPAMVASAPAPDAPPSSDAELAVVTDSLPPPTEARTEAPAADSAPAPIVRMVHFALNSDRLTMANRAVLDTVAKLATTAHAVRLEIRGHTDPLGSARYNQELARRRADRVAAYLRSRGLTQPLVVRAFGSSQPATAERTRAGNARNRRVEITIATPEGTTSPSSTAERRPH